MEGADLLEDAAGDALVHDEARLARADGHVVGEEDPPGENVVHHLDVTMQRNESRPSLGEASSSAEEAPSSLSPKRNFADARPLEGLIWMTPCAAS